MIQEDHELLAELARLNTVMASPALRICGLAYEQGTDSTRRAYNMHGGLCKNVFKKFDVSACRC